MNLLECSFHDSSPPIPHFSHFVFASFQCLSPRYPHKSIPPSIPLGGQLSMNVPSSVSLLRPHVDTISRIEIGAGCKLSLFRVGDVEVGRGELIKGGTKLR